MKAVKISGYFTRTELLLWISSIFIIIGSYLLFDRSGVLKLISSLVGATSLIFCAKGNPLGQLLIIIFSVFYGIISYSFAYYGEMITYLGLTAPMAVLSLISWLRNPYNGSRSQVAVNRLNSNEIPVMLMLTAAVTAIFCLILKRLGTANIIPSTISIATSFAAIYLTFRRSPLYALAYALNDAVLIVLWSMAASEDISYISVTVCFVIFLVNDIYGFINWQRMKNIQSVESPTEKT